MNDVLAAAHGRVGTRERPQLVAQCERAGEPRSERKLPVTPARERGGGAPGGGGADDDEGREILAG